MKSILLSIRPEHAVNVLNGFKTLELRKSVPKDFKGWVYIYCTKGVGKTKYHHLYNLTSYNNGKTLFSITHHNKYSLVPDGFLNGKVVARFWLDEYDEMSYMTCNGYEYDYYATNNKDKAFGWCVDSNYIEDFCLEYQDILNYGYNKKKRKQVNLYAWHIKNLEIFDKPKELREFYRVNIEEELPTINVLKGMFAIKKPPQSWQYVYTKESKDE